MDELVSKISNIFKRDGIKGITMDDISRKLCMSKKTLYLYFENKKDVVLKVTQYEIKSEIAELNKLIGINTNAIDQLLIISEYLVNKLRSINPIVTYDMDKYYPQILEKLIGQRKEYICRFIKRNFLIGIKQDIYRENLDIDVIADFYTYQFDIKGFEVFSKGLDNDFEKIFNTIFMYHIRGVANSKGIEYIGGKIQQPN